MNKKNTEAVKPRRRDAFRRMSMRLSVLTCALALGLSVLPAQAVELGHSRVASAPGEPLVIVIPVVDVPSSDNTAISIKLAEPAQWQAAGLTPPVPLETLSLSVQAGRDSAERLVRVTSPQVSDKTVIDVLIDVSTASARRTLQTSIIVPPPPEVRLAGQTIVVQRGDTLIGIAQQFPVEGANLYQELWALYSDNTGAFMRENMNLLKAGASLRIPDAETVRAIDPAFAKAQYLAHVRAFRQGTGASQGNLGIPAQAQAQTIEAKPQETQRGVVEPAQTEPPTPVNDQVRLTAADSPEAATEADIATSARRQRSEEVDRQQSLEQNVEALQAAITELQEGAATLSSASADGGTRGGDATASAAAASASAGSVVSTSDGSTASTAGATAGTTRSGATGSGTTGSGTTGSGTTGSGTTGSGSAGSTTSGAGADGAFVSGAADTTSESSAQADAQSKRVAAATAGSSNGQVSGGQVSGGATDGSANEPLAAQNAFSRASQWVSDNTTAAVAILLALIALILAWALRSGKDKAASGMAVQRDSATAKFEEKLKEIDLTLDDQPEHTPSKPDQKA